jgi:hypothetical protein
MNGKWKDGLKKNPLQKEEEERLFCSNFILEIMNFFFKNFDQSSQKSGTRKREKNCKLFYIKSSYKEVTLAFFVFQKLETN